MRRVMILGCPGSGKSTFARALADMTGLQLIYMDRLFWNEDRTSVSRDLLDERLADVVKREKWIIDGNYQRTLRIRLDSCDTVFLFDLPLDVCLQGIRSRIGTVREDLPWVEPELDPDFEQYVKDFPTHQLPEIYELLKEYPQIDLTVFKDRDDIEKYLKQAESEA
ncbi:MAG: adenylate kinase [Oscillospiraceae bacterium]|nr:adenylate kinase [Oscillospiraceae bacterium]